MARSRAYAAHKTLCRHICYCPRWHHVCVQASEPGLTSPGSPRGIRRCVPLATAGRGVGGSRSERKQAGSGGVAGFVVVVVVVVVSATCMVRGAPCPLACRPPSPGHVCPPSSLVGRCCLVIRRGGASHMAGTVPQPKPLDLHLPSGCRPPKLARPPTHWPLPQQARRRPGLPARPRPDRQLH